MIHPSEFERLQIESVLSNKSKPADPGMGLFIFPESPIARRVHHIAVEPAMQANSLSAMASAFDSDSALAVVCRHVQTAEMIVADVTDQDAHVMYVLGLAHGLGRCPLLIARGTIELPFNMQSLRCIEHGLTREALYVLRDDMTRAVRVFLAAARATSG